MSEYLLSQPSVAGYLGWNYLAFLFQKAIHASGPFDRTWLVLLSYCIIDLFTVRK